MGGTVRWRQGLAVLVGLSVALALLIVVEGTLLLFQRRSTTTTTNNNAATSPLPMLHGGEPSTPGSSRVPCVLFFTDSAALRYPRTAADYQFFWRWRAAAASLDAFAWGPGFAGWDGEQSLRTNLLRRFGSVRVDAVVATAAMAEAVRDVSAETVVVLLASDCPTARAVCIRRVVDSGAAVVLLPRAAALADHAELSHRRLFVHSPDCVPTSLFFHNVSDDNAALRQRRAGSVAVLRTTAIEQQKQQQSATSMVITTTTTTTTTTLSERWMRLVDARTMTGSSVVVVEDPRGSRTMRRRLPPRRRLLPFHQHDNIDNDIDYGDDAEAPMAEMAKQLGEVEMVLLDARMPTQVMADGFAEAALAGALIVSDMPSELEQEWDGAVAEVNAGMQDAELLGAVQWWQAHSEQRLLAVSRAQNIALQHFSCAAAVDTLAEAIQRFIAGRRGFWFPNPHAVPP